MHHVLLIIWCRSTNKTMTNWSKWMLLKLSLCTVNVVWFRNLRKMVESTCNLAEPRILCSSYTVRLNTTSGHPEGFKATSVTPHTSHIQQLGGYKLFFGSKQTWLVLQLQWIKSVYIPTHDGHLYKIPMRLQVTSVTCTSHTRKTSHNSHNPGCSSVPSDQGLVMYLTRITRVYNPFV